MWDEFTRFPSESLFWMVCFRVYLHRFFLQQIFLPKNVSQIRWKFKGRPFEMFDAQLGGGDSDVRGARRPPFLDLHGWSRYLGHHTERGSGWKPWQSVFS
jgi:hypothetical protein